MTDDTHNIDPNDPHAEHGFEHAGAADQEVWHGEPVDDFGDESAATVSEEVNEPNVEAVEDPKKRTALLPIAIVVGGVLFLGAVIYLQFGNMFHSSTSASLPLTSKSAAMKTASNDVAPKTGMLPPIAATDTMNATALPVPASSGVAVAAPNLPAIQPVQPTVSTSDSNASMPSISSASSSSLPPPMPVASLPPPSPIVPAAVPVTPAAVAPVPSSMPAAPVTSAADEARLTALSSRIDDLQRTMAQTSQQLSQINDKLTSNASGSGSSALAIDDRLNKIEQKLVQIEHTTPTLSDNVPSGTALQPTEQENPVKVASSNPTSTTSTSHHSTHHTHHTTTTHHKAVKVASSKGSTKAKPTSTHWVLRAATDDQAWVATDSTTAELRPVVVGDDLKGIGRVTSIREGDSGWMIEGTKGTIH